MRTLIDIEEEDIEQLDTIAAEQKQSRAALIREAVSEYLAKRRRKTIDDAFGLWGDHKIDGLAHQKKNAVRMVKALFDSSILIDYLKTIPQARVELSRYADRAISIVAWMEVLVSAPPDKEGETREFLAAFTLINIDADVAQRAVDLRRAHHIKLPDALVWASAQVHGMLLVTRNTKDFPANDPGVRHPYSI